MADTNFVPGTVITSDWLNDINDKVYGLADTTDTTKGGGQVGIGASLPYGAGTAGHAAQRALAISMFPGADPTGATACDAAINAAISSASTLRVPLLVDGVFRHAAQIVIPAKFKLHGNGWTSEASTSGRCASVLLKDFNGVGVLFSGDDSSADGIQFDSVAARTGDGVQITGSRVRLSNGSTTNAGNDGLRIGATDSGPSTKNANCFSVQNWISINNGRDGVHIDDTNTTTSASYPLGFPNANAGRISHLLVGSTGVGNGRDGLRVANCIDNVFENIVSQENTAHGIRFTTSARGHKIFGFYCENNVAGGLLFDSGASSNMAIGGDANIAANAPVDNDGSNTIFAPYQASSTPGMFWNMLRVLNSSAAGFADIDLYADTNYTNAVRLRGSKTASSRGLATIQTKANGGALADRLLIDELQFEFKATTNGVLFNKSAVDTTTPGININGTGARIDYVNSGTGATTVHGFYNGNGSVGSISTSGTATSFNTSSDYRLKEGITDADGAQAFASVMSWPVREFSFKAEPLKRQIGFIAHELQAVCPLAVTGEKDAVEVRPVFDADGQQVGERKEIKAQGVDTSKLVPELVAAVQHLAGRVAALEGRKQE